MDNTKQQRLCWQCILDPVLRVWVRRAARADKCTFCGLRRRACSLTKVAEKIDAVMRQFYRPGEMTAHIVDHSDNLEYWEEGDPAHGIIQEIAGVDEEVAGAIVGVLHAAEWRAVSDGEDAYYGDTPLQHIPTYPDEFMELWFRFEQRLTHEVRFFDEEGKQMLDELFGDLPFIAQGKAIVTLEPAREFSTIYRARIVSGESDLETFFRDAAKHVGPPPPHLARAGRMNPAGISAFYGAFSEQVAVAEIRPPVGSTVIIGKFSLQRPVRLLDVSFLPHAFHEESIFSPSYDRLRNKVAFLEKFHRHISRPVLPDDEVLSYLPTQAVAAYVTNVMGLDGVIYSSTQVGAEGEAFEQVARDVCNVALFGEAAIVQASQVPLLRNDGELNIEPDARSVAKKNDAIAPADSLADNNTDVAGEAVLCVNRTRSTSPNSSSSTSQNRKTTLRVEGEPTVVRIRSVSVQTSPIFAHQYPDGKVIIDDFEYED